MENCARLFSQIAAESGVTSGRAKIAAYLFGLSAQGATLERASAALRRKPATVKTICREHLIDLADYRPFDRQRLKGEIIEPKHPLNLGAA